MQLTVITTSDVAQELRGRYPSGAARAIVDAIANAGGELFPQDYSQEEFAVEIADGTRGRELARRLAGMDGVRSAYVEPPVGA